MSHKSETTQPKFFLKMLDRVTYFYTFVQLFGSKFKIPIATENEQLFYFLHLKNRHLMAQQMAKQ